MVARRGSPDDAGSSLHGPHPHPRATVASIDAYRATARVAPTFIERQPTQFPWKCV
jgi:hypothetical protein